MQDVRNVVGIPLNYNLECKILMQIGLCCNHSVTATLQSSLSNGSILSLLPLRLPGQLTWYIRML